MVRISGFWTPAFSLRRSLVTPAIRRRDRRRSDEVENGRALTRSARITDADAAFTDLIDDEVVNAPGEIGHRFGLVIGRFASTVIALGPVFGVQFPHLLGRLRLEEAELMSPIVAVLVIPKVVPSSPPIATAYASMDRSTAPKLSSMTAV